MTLNTCLVFLLLPLAVLAQEKRNLTTDEPRAPKASPPAPPTTRQKQRRQTASISL